MTKKNTISISVYYVCIAVACLYWLQLGELVVARFMLPAIGCVLFFFVMLIKNRGLVVSERLFRFFMVVFLLYFSSIIGAQSLGGLLFDIVKIMLAISSLCVGYIIFSRYSLEKTLKIVKIMVILAIFFLALELYIRVILPFGFFARRDNFYLMKVESPFFYDSNAVGIYATFLFSLVLYFRKWLQPLYFLFFAVSSFSFVLGSLSRAAVISSLAVTFYSICRSLPRIAIVLFIIVLSGALIPYFFLIVDFFTSDGSGKTKFAIYSKMYDIFCSYSLVNQLFGFGIEKGNFAYSYQEGSYAHALLPMLLGEVGLVGTFVYFLYWFYCFSKSKAILYLIIPMLLLGFSFLPPFYETMFFCGGVILGFEYSRRQVLKGTSCD